MTLHSPSDTRKALITTSAETRLRVDIALDFAVFDCTGHPANWFAGKELSKGSQVQGICLRDYVDHFHFDLPKAQRHC